MSATMRLAVAGDITATRRLTAAQRSGERAAIGELLAGADVAIGCFEVPLTDRGSGLDKQVLYRADAAIAGDYRALGFDVMSLANNHSLNYGEPGLRDTCAAFEAAGLRHLGAGPDLDAAAAPLRLQTPGGTLGLLAVSCLLPTGTAADHQRAGVNPLRIHTAYQVDASFLMEEPGVPPQVLTWPDEGDLARLTAAIAALRPTVDVLALAIHWGIGTAPELVSYQRPLGRRLIEAGVDLVLGSHARVLHGVEAHAGGLIVYSQGSFAAQVEGATRWPEGDDEPLPGDGMVAEVVVEAGARPAVALHPTVVADDGVAVPASGADHARICERLTACGARLGTPVARDGTTLVVRADGAGDGR